MAKDCKSVVRCGQSGCRGRHHRLLHASKPGNKASPSSEAEVSCALTRGSHLPARLGVIPVKLDTPAQRVTTYAFLDTGSDITLVKRDLLVKYGVGLLPTSMAIATLGGPMECTSESNDIGLLSADENQSIGIDRAFVVDSLPMRAAPSIKEVASSWLHLDEIPFDELAEEEEWARTISVGG
ncbi:NIMA (never in mitosis gene a)-related kinase 6 [Clonorchis sinensis]|uniref:NIMA (Never in mitosis gene a)-related kinase 6 n=1 Tax=Clonorchis sinensis TaxID=79923 RepID=G7Y5H8_CLOSI|nr:NIMA (never in mitosis gene a)-related kinase 6 [Clonorchis sinensis]